MPLFRKLKDRGNPSIRVMLPQSHEIRVVCGVVISSDIDLPYGFLDRVTDVFPGLVSRGAGDGFLALIVRIEHPNQLTVYYKNCRFISRR